MISVGEELNNKGAGCTSFSSDGAGRKGRRAGEDAQPARLCVGDVGRETPRAGGEVARPWFSADDAQRNGAGLEMLGCGESDL